MSRKQQFKVRDILAAIKNTGGIKIHAAKKLGCDRHTIDNYEQRYESVRDAIQEETDIVGDLAESECIKKIKEGDSDIIKFYLRTKCKKRGYIEKSEVEHSGEISVTNFLNSLPSATAGAARRLLAEEIARKRTGRKSD